MSAGTSWLPYRTLRPRTRAAGRDEDARGHEGRHGVVACAEGALGARADGGVTRLERACELRGAGAETQRTHARQAAGPHRSDGDGERERRALGAGQPVSSEERGPGRRQVAVGLDELAACAPAVRQSAPGTARGHADEGDLPVQERSHERLVGRAGCRVAREGLERAAVVPPAQRDVERARVAGRRCWRRSIRPPQRPPEGGEGAREAHQQLGQLVLQEAQERELLGFHRQERPRREEVGVRVDQRALLGRVARPERHVGRYADDGAADVPELFAERASRLWVHEVERHLHAAVERRAGAQVETRLQRVLVLAREPEDQREDRGDAVLDARRDPRRYVDVRAHALLVSVAHGARRGLDAEQHAVAAGASHRGEELVVEVVDARADLPRDVRAARLEFGAELERVTPVRAEDVVAQVRAARALDAAQRLDLIGQPRSGERPRAAGPRASDRAERAVVDAAAPRVERHEAVLLPAQRLVVGDGGEQVPRVVGQRAEVPDLRPVGRAERAPVRGADHEPGDVPERAALRERGDQLDERDLGLSADHDVDGGEALEQALLHAVHARAAEDELSVRE
ncbi:MAG: hypothetical protein AAFP86_09255, partial [Planctomycetota bacterium]